MAIIFGRSLPAHSAMHFIEPSEHTADNPKPSRRYTRCPSNFLANRQNGLGHKQDWHRVTRCQRRVRVFFERWRPSHSQQQRGGEKRKRVYRYVMSRPRFWSHSLSEHSRRLRFKILPVWAPQVMVVELDPSDSDDRLDAVCKEIVRQERREVGM